MNAAAHRMEGNANAPVLYMALELSNKTWRLAFGDGASIEVSRRLRHVKTDRLDGERLLAKVIRLYTSGLQLGFERARPPHAAPRLKKFSRSRSSILGKRGKLSPNSSTGLPDNR